MAMATFSIDSVAADCPQCRPAVPSCYPGIQLEQGLSLCWTSALDSCSYYSLPRPKGISVTRPASCRRQGSPTPRRKKTVDAADADDDVVVAVAAAAAVVIEPLVASFVVAYFLLPQPAVVAALAVAAV